MPKQTFFNLPEEKRAAILDIAVDEFAEHEYSEVSISRIVERAGIAKGSFYQYFEDKKDLFFHLLDVAAQRKLAFLQGQQPPDPQMGLFPYIRFLFIAGLKYQFAWPKMNMVGYKALYGTLPFRDETLQRIKDAAAGYYRQLIDMGIANGDVAPGVDRDMAAFFLGAVLNDLGNYYFRKMGLDSRVMVERPFTETELQVLIDTIDGAITLIKDGIGVEQSP